MNESDSMKSEHQILHQLLDYAIGNEAKFNEENARRVASERMGECTPPKICHEFQTARLFLSHFGFLNLESGAQSDLNAAGNGGLIALDPTLAGFAADLEGLDHISARTCDTVQVFYVKAGQSSPEAILANVVSFRASFFLVKLMWEIICFRLIVLICLGVLLDVHELYKMSSDSIFGFCFIE